MTDEARIKERLEDLLEDYDYTPKYRIDVMGKKVNVPVKYEDATAFMFFFSIESGKAKELIGTKRLKPVSILGGRCLLGITIFDYITCPVGPYRELALSIPVTLDAKISVPFLPLIFDSSFGKSGFYTIILAMNTDIAREHSEKIFGYPAFNRTIEVDIKRDSGFISIDSREGSEKILSLKMKSLSGAKAKRRKYSTYFVKNNNIINVEMHAVAYEVGSMRNNDLILDLGNHKISNIIKTLSARPHAIKSIYYANAIEILEAPKEVGIA